MSTRSRLTSEQQAAATTSSTRAFIVAAPGSGKTTVAAERFGVIRYDTPADLRRILALSFTKISSRRTRSSNPSPLGQQGHVVATSSPDTRHTSLRDLDLSPSAQGHYMDG